MSYQRSNIRPLLGLALFASALFAPPWLVAAFALSLAVRWQAWEVVAAGMLMDFLWLPASVTSASVESLPLSTLISIILVVGLEPLRRQLLLGADV